LEGTVDLQGNGLLLDLPPAWSGRLFTHIGDEDSDNRPTVHMASFALPTDDADFGGGVISAMSGANDFVSLIEYTPDCYVPDDIYVETVTEDSAASLLDSFLDPSVSGFDNGLPTLAAADFGPEAVYGETAPVNATALQTAFSLAGRPFYLYTVVGDVSHLSSSVATVNSILQTLVVSPVVQGQLILTITFDKPLEFAPLINIGGAKGPSGSCTGSGTGTCVFARADGSASEAVPASYTFAGSYNGTNCFSQFHVDGTLSTLLANGRSVEVPMRLNILEMDGATVGQLYTDPDPVFLPALVQPNGGACDGCTGIDVTGVFVFRADALSATTVPH
jgi:hypothetical protein